jgi:hypothetical protein
MLAKHTPLMLLGITAVFAISGCASTSPERAERMQRGYLYYCDGAGGGGITNWAGGIRQGLMDAGYDGAGEMFTWETGLGVAADQVASNEYKRGKANELAQEMTEFHRKHPDAPMTLMGLSAGTAVAVFTLEALPSNVMVENVILLSGSLSSPYNLTKALRRVHGKVYITTSHRDTVLGSLMPLAGTADRGSGTTATIGIEGPRLPPGATSETRRLYASKLMVIPWKQEFARYGNHGGHTDTVAAPFIEHYIAPLVETNSGVQFASKAAAPPGMVKNPAYARWENFEPGSWVLAEGQRTVDGVTKPVRVKITLVSKSDKRLVYQRDVSTPSGHPDDVPIPQTVYESAYVAPDESPMTHSAARIRNLPDTTIRVGDRNVACKVKSVSAPADFHNWGDHPQATIYSCEKIPGHLVRMDIKTRLGQQTVALTATAVDYHAARK